MEKPGFALLIGKDKKDGPVESPSKDEHAEDLKDSPAMDGPMAQDSAVKDIMSALKSGDHILLKEALKDFVEMCSGGGADEEAEAGEPGEESESGAY